MTINKKNPLIYEDKVRMRDFKIIVGYNYPKIECIAIGNLCLHQQDTPVEIRQKYLSSRILEIRTYK